MSGVGADFAWRLMKSQGWSDGDGLGKSRQGRKDALKPKLKFDQHGLGHDRAEEFEFHWWDHVFNSAVKGVTVNNSDCGEITVEFKADKSEISAKKLRKRMQKEMRNKLYSRFVKSGTMEGSLLIKSPEEEEAVTEVKDLSQIKNLTDDDLVKACGGRTAHKGARHGQNMSAKLKRVEDAELAFIASIQAKQKEKEARKLKQSKICASTLPVDTIISETKPGQEDAPTPLGEDSPPLGEETEKKRKKKKKNKDKSGVEEDEGIVCETKVEVLSELLNEDCDKKRKKKEKIRIDTENSPEEHHSKERKKSKKRKRDKDKDDVSDNISQDTSQLNTIETDENLHKKKKKKKNKHNSQ